MHSWTPDHWSALGSVIQAVATVLTLGVAVMAARFAGRQVREARAQVEEARRTREAQAEQVRQAGEEQSQREQRLREEQARPLVVVDFEPSPVWGNIIELVFENVGNTLAKNVRFHFDPPLKSSHYDTNGEESLEDSVLLTRGIPAMPPGKRFATLFDISHERIKTDLPMTYSVRVELEDYQGRKQEPLEYVLDLAYRYDQQRIETKTINNVAESLEKIERRITQWTQHFNGVRVWVRDEDAYFQREREEFEARRSGDTATRDDAPERADEE